MKPRRQFIFITRELNRCVVHAPGCEKTHIPYGSFDPAKSGYVTAVLKKLRKRKEALQVDEEGR